MADWSEDEWDSSSPIGSPSSSLPQSIREALEIVKAECNADMLRDYKGVENLPSMKDAVTPSQKTAPEVDSTKGMATVNDRREVNSDSREEFPRLTALESAAPEKIGGCSRTTPDSEPQADLVESPRVKFVRDLSHTDDSKPEAQNAQEGPAKRATGTFEWKSQRLVHTQQKDLLKLKRDKIDMHKILSDGYRKANAGHWIKIDSPIVKNVKSTTENHLKLSNESGPLPSSKSKVKEGAQNIGLQNKAKSQGERMNHTFVEKELIGLEARGPVENLANSNVEVNPFSEKHQLLTDPMPDKQVFKCIDLTDSSESSEPIAKGIEGRRVDRIVQTYNALKFGRGKKRTSNTSCTLPEEKTGSPKCSSVQNRVKSLQPGDIINLREGEDKPEVRTHGTGCFDLRLDSKSPERHSLETGMNQEEERGTSLEPPEGGETGTFKKGEPPSILLNGKAGDHCNVGKDGPVKEESLHEMLRGKYLSMDDSEEMASEQRKNQGHTSGYEGLEEFKFACGDPPMVDVKNIKEEIFSDDECQAMERGYLFGNNDSGEGVCESEGESKTNALTTWRQELLKSDFNLIYGSLRAVLMRNLSNDDRHRLIQTMISTMGEIEEVVMGEGKPVQHSVRCETPEVMEEVEDVMEGVMEDVMEESKENLVGKEDLLEMSFKDRERVMNEKRMKILMKSCPDGMLKCLVCKKDGLPNDRPCRACCAFAYRVEKNYTIGVPVPSCHHKKYSRAPKCKSCRFRKFSFMSPYDTETRLRKVQEKTCPICKRNSFHFRGWKCLKCYHIFTRITKRGKAPTCEHSGEYPTECNGCLCYNFQIAWPKFELNRKFPLPVVKSECDT